MLLPDRAGHRQLNRRKNGGFSRPVCPGKQGHLRKGEIKVPRIKMRTEALRDMGTMYRVDFLSLGRGADRSRSGAGGSFGSNELERLVAQGFRRGGTDGLESLIIEGFHTKFVSLQGVPPFLLRLCRRAVAFPKECVPDRQPGAQFRFLQHQIAGEIWIALKIETDMLVDLRKIRIRKDAYEIQVPA